MPNPVGAPAEEEAQGSITFLLQIAATADGNGTVAQTDGYNGCQMLELQKAGTGTTSVVVEGSYDGGVTWYAAGYQQVDGASSLARAAAAITLAAGTVNHVYQVLELYPLLRARLSGTTGAVTLTARLYAVGV